MATFKHDAIFTTFKIPCQLQRDIIENQAVRYLQKSGWTYYQT